MRLFLATSVLALLTAAPAADAQVFYGSFPLSGAEEVPPNASPNTGTAFMTINTTTNVVTWNIVHTVAATASHIHGAPAGSNGGVLLNIGPPASPMIGSGTMFPGDVAALLAGNTYVNVHSGAFPGGEIRGQVHLQWEDLGGAFGSFGPNLVGGGPLTGGSTATLSATGLPPNQQGLAWLSFQPAPFPYFGGTVHAFPFSTQVFLASNAAGQVNIGTTWPTGLPAGIQGVIQILVNDPGIIGGISLTNGVRFTTP